MTSKPSLAPELYTEANRPRDFRLMEQMREQDLTPESTDSSLPRFTLVVGHSPFTMPRGWEYYLTAPYEGASCIATAVANAGFPVRIVDVRYAPDPVEAAWRQVREGSDVVGITTFEDNFPFARELIRRLKDSDPDLLLVAGGSLVTSLPHVFFEHTALDVAVISEGELTILELMQAVAEERLPGALSEIAGIWYRGPEGETRQTRPRGQMPDLDCVPRLRLDLWPQARSRRGLQPQVITSYSRGCKMDCSFCYRTTPQVRVRSPERFDRELKWLTEQYGVDFLFFSDLTFNAERDRTRAICEVLEPYNLRWTSMCRCADADGERLRAMDAAGCDLILFGVESLGADALKEARKPTTENLTLRALQRTQQTGIRFGALLIVGLPGETEESLEHMARWAEEYQHVVRVKYLSAMPGTSVYRQALRDGFIRDEVSHLEWLSTEQALYEDEFINYANLPEAAVRKAYQRMYDAYQPGPVMDFHHWPEHFEYFYPNPDDGSEANVDYAGKGWRARFSSAGPHLAPGSWRYTLDRVGAPGMAEKGAALVKSGAARMRPEEGS